MKDLLIPGAISTLSANPTCLYMPETSGKSSMDGSMGWQSSVSDDSSLGDDSFCLSTTFVQRSTSIIRSSSIRIGSISKQQSETDSFTINKLNFGSELYGREKEEEDLKSLVQASMKGSKEFLLIGGGAGSGKSVLAHKVRGLTRREGGFSVSGKFEMFLSDEPYSAVGDAFRTLCDDLLLYKGQQGDNRWKFLYTDFAEKLKCSFSDEDFNMLRSVMPSLAQLVAISSGAAQADEFKSELPAQSISYPESKQAFCFAFHRLLGILASFAPLVIVMDDLHWADQASMDLVEFLLADDRTPGLMLIGTYRDDEVNEGHTPHDDGAAPSVPGASRNAHHRDSTRKLVRGGYQYAAPAYNFCQCGEVWAAVTVRASENVGKRSLREAFSSVAVLRRAPEVRFRKYEMAV